MRCQLRYRALRSHRLIGFSSQRSMVHVTCLYFCIFLRGFLCECLSFQSLPHAIVYISLDATVPESSIFGSSIISYHPIAQRNKMQSLPWKHSAHLGILMINFAYGKCHKVPPMLFQSAYYLFLYQLI